MCFCGGSRFLRVINILNEKWCRPGRNLRLCNIPLSWLKSTIKWLMLSLALALRERRKAGAIVTLRTKSRDTHTKTQKTHRSGNKHGPLFNWNRGKRIKKQVILPLLTKRRPLTRLLLLPLTHHPGRQLKSGAREGATREGLTQDGTDRRGQWETQRQKALEKQSFPECLLSTKWVVAR